MKAAWGPIGFATASALLVAACEAPTTPSAGILVVRVQGTGAFSGTVRLDSVRVVLSGPTDTTITSVPGDSVAIKGLKGGAYAVTLVGFKGGSVLYFGLAKNVQLSAGVDTANVSFSPPGLTVNAGNNQTSGAGRPLPINPSVIAQDSSGDPVAGVHVTFTVVGGGGSLGGANPVTTDAAGIAAAVWDLGSSPGANTLTATATGLSGSPATFTATASGGPPPPSPWPNDPYSLGTAGWSVVTDYGFTDPLPDGSSNCQQIGTSGWAVSNGISITGGGLSYLADPTAPYIGQSGFTNRVAQFFYPTGFVAGSAPATLNYGAPTCGTGTWPGGSTAQTYVGFYFKYSSTWYNEGASNKLGEVWDNYSTIGTYIEYSAGTVGFNPLTTDMEVEASNISTTDYGNNQANTTITLNTWHLWEALWTYTATGQPGAATYERWLDGVLQARYTGVPVNGSGVQAYQFFPDWGGGGNTVPADQYLWLAHIRITVHP